MFKCFFFINETSRRSVSSFESSYHVNENFCSFLSVSKITKVVARVHGIKHAMLTANIFFPNPLTRFMFKGSVN